MARSDNLYELPADLPVPVDDGGCSHLQGIRLPDLPLLSTSGDLVNLSNLPGSTVIYCYPRTGVPDKDPPPGWDLVPGARGCTPQSCGFRDHFQELQSLGARVFGLSTQSRDYQREVVDRLHLPFDLLSDEQFQFIDSLNLPTAEINSLRLVKRLTLITTDGLIAKVFYPVFPPDKNAEEVIAWLSSR